MTPVAPTTCKLNAIMDFIVGQLRLRVKAKSGKNLVLATPTVKRILRLGDLTSLAKPYIAVQLVSWECNPQSARRLVGDLRWVAHCQVDAGPGDDEQRLLDLVTDVLRAMLVDETLGGMVDYTFPAEFAPQVDQSGSTGFGAADLTFICSYKWDADTP